METLILKKFEWRKLSHWKLAMENPLSDQLDLQPGVETLILLNRCAKLSHLLQRSGLLEWHLFHSIEVIQASPAWHLFQREGQFGADFLLTFADFWF